MSAYSSQMLSPVQYARDNMLLGELVLIPQSPPDTTSIIPVVRGGTTRTSLDNNYFLVGAGTDPVQTTKIAPTGDVVGTTDPQTLTGKTIYSVGNVVDANLIRNIGISTTAPKLGQVLTATTPASDNITATGASWQDPIDPNAVTTSLGSIPVTDNAIVRYDGTTGRYIQQGTAILEDTGDIRITGRYIMPDTTSSAAGVIVSRNVPVFHLYTQANAYNLFVGPASGNFTNSGVNNSVFGITSAAMLSSGSLNTILGTSSARNLTTGEKNVIAGSFSGNNIVAGARNLYLGVPSGDVDNSNGNLPDESDAIRVGFISTSNSAKTYISGIQQPIPVANNPTMTPMMISDSHQIVNGLLVNSACQTQLRGGTVTLVPNVWTQLTLSSIAGSALSSKSTQAYLQTGMNANADGTITWTGAQTSLFVLEGILNASTDTPTKTIEIMFTINTTDHYEDVFTVQFPSINTATVRSIQQLSQNDRIFANVRCNTAAVITVKTWEMFVHSLVPICQPTH